MWQLAIVHSNFFQQNGHSIQELAKSTGNLEIMDLIRKSQTMAKQEEPLINLLSNYLQKKENDTVAKREVCTYFMY